MPTTGLTTSVLQPNGSAYNLAAEEGEGASGSKAARLGKNVNTASSDFAPYRYADRLYFSSALAGKNGKEPTHQIFSAILDAPAVPWSENTAEPGVHTTHTAFSPDGKRIYFTFCQDRPTGGQRCEIYTRERAFEGYWLPYRRLPRSINQDEYTATQPSIGFDYRLRKEVLYFVSDRPGGMGGLDIWCSPIEANDTYGKPFPLPFNSPQDDVSPFAYQQGHALFFSSNRPGDQGGLDIYKAKKTGATWATPVPLGQSFNSPYDELYFSCHQASGKGYFASNRPGCKSPDPVRGCIGYDIFVAPMLTELEVKAATAAGETLLEDASVQLVEAGTGASVSATSADQRHFFIEPGKRYRLTVAASGYLPETLAVAATAADALSKVEQLVRLRQNAKLYVQTFNAFDSTAIGGVGFVFSSENGGETISHRNEEGTSEQSFMVAFGGKSKLEAVKQGYKTATVNFDPPASGPSAVLNVRVYLQPFASLPIALYFDNDRPRWDNPAQDEAKLTYEHAYNEYLARKPIFLEKYAEGLAQEAYEAARQKVLAFFDNEVTGGLRQLDELCSQIEPHLKKGQHLQLVVDMEASPLANADYNKQLSARRVASLRNYLKTWRNGALKSYLYSGKLAITSEFLPPSEEFSGDLTDRKQVEFSPEASRLRKLVIKEVRLQTTKA